MSENLDALYANYHQVLFRVVSRFLRRFGGDFDDLLSQAGEHFVDGCYKYPENCETPFPNWLSQFIYYRLFNKWRVERRSRIRTESIEDTSGWELDWDIPWQDWHSNLSEDAKTVIETILYPPKDLAFTIHIRGGTRYAYRNSLCSHLKHFGWSVERITNSYEEIEYAIQETYSRSEYDPKPGPDQRDGSEMGGDDRP